jgi:N-acetyl-anhydromuramyl-L-alanine amidase AmpD
VAQSPEYPDLAWVEPASWTNANRTSVQLVVIHDTEGSSHSQSAEDGAAYDARRTDGTSTHYFHDNNSTVQCVRTADQAHTARTQGNKRGIHHELCAKASFSRSQWLSEDYGLPMLRRAAKQAARDAKKWDIPVRKLSPSQVADGVKGFCGHGDVTKAFPQDNGTHTDPGPNFPWDVFIDMVQDALNPEEELPVDQATFNKLMNGWASTETGQNLLGKAVAQYELSAPAGAQDSDGKWWLQSYLANTYPAAVSARTYSAEARTNAAAAADAANKAVAAAEAATAAVQALSKPSA